MIATKNLEGPARNISYDKLGNYYLVHKDRMAWMATRSKGSRADG